MELLDELSSEIPELDKVDITGLIFDLCSPDFVEVEIDNQLKDDIFTINKINYMKIYSDRYKLIKNNLSQEDEDYEENLQKIKDNKDEFIDFVIDHISDKFDITYTKNNPKIKHIKALYNFLVIDYVDNLTNLFLNYIMSNKKQIIQTLKEVKGKRDLSTVANKQKYYNAQDILIINNIEFIINEIICGTEFGNKELFDLLVYQDDCNDNALANDLAEEGLIEIGENFAISYLESFIDQDDGYAIIISNVVCELSSLARKNELELI